MNERSGTLSQIRAFFAQAFANKQARANLDRVSKHRPFGNEATGMEEAEKYKVKRWPLSASRTSSLKKLSRYNRIALGERPAKFDVMGKRERKTLSKIMTNQRRN